MQVVVYREVLDLTEHEKMEIFLREILMNIESEQNITIRRLEDFHRKVESLNREKVLVEQKLQDNISFFNPTCAKNREKLDEINQSLLKCHNEIDATKEQLKELNSKINTMGKIVMFLKEHSPEVEKKVKEPNYFTASGISILEAQEMERKRIARDLHDSTVQSLTNIVHKTEYCSKMIDKDAVQVKFELVSMMENIRNCIDDMRRIIYDLRPMSIDDLGLVPTIQRFVEQNKAEHDDMKFKIQVTSESAEVDLPSVVTLTIFRIVQEACNNIFKYSQAENVTIVISYLEDNIVVSVQDDGIGFDKNSIGKGEKNTSSGFGLSIMQERVQLLYGSFSIDSELGKGTKVTIEIPYGTGKRETTSPLAGELDSYKYTR